MKSASVALEKKLNGSGTFPDSRCPGGCPGLKKFHTDSNNNIQAALQQTADLYKRRVDIAKAEFSQVKGVLGAVDLDFPTKTPKGQNLSDVCPKSSESICQMPGDFDSKLAGLAGVPDLQSTDFDAKKKDALDKKNEFAGKQTEFKNQAIALNTLATTCKKEAGDKKLAKGVGKIREDFNRKLSKCKAAAGRLNATPPDFGPQLDGLQADLQRVCAADTANDDCSKLSSEMADASTACNDIFDDRLQKKKDADDAKANGRCALCDRAACAQVGLPVPPACEGGKIGVDSNKK
ncbi:MAG: hypothetical protein HY074_02575 [Deltaproteobacteria bacterium]|nr:hypothetical protein [Deltaproteobacteria bacterium]